ncbi:MAG: tol-pal system protein YbgF [Pseudomonadota bacterium]|jgi:tol-pal system protein YbgF
MMRMLRLACLLALAPLAAFGQDRAQTLADIRAELSALSAQFNALKSELVTTGAAASGAAGGDALARMDAIEAQLAQLTGKTEEVELKLNAVITDGTRRVNDLEFRVCELTEGCDIAALASAQPLGGGATTGGGAAVPATPTEPAAPVTGGPELAVGEQADFDRAREVLGQGDFRAAADLFATFTQSYPGGPLTQEAHVLRGDALAQLGDTAGAARAYLDGFSGQPSGPKAGEALLKLGQSLGTLGQTPEACVTLQEVGTRFPASPEAASASVAMQGLGCS